MLSLLTAISAGGAGGSSTRNSTLMADGVKQRSWRESQPNSRRMSRSRQSNTSDGSRLAETELPPMFEVSDMPQV